MPLDRDHVVQFDATPVTDEAGRTTRNKTLYPCGCWQAEVWRIAQAPPVGFTGPSSPEGWHPQSGACPTHSAQAVVLQLALAVQLNGPQEVPSWGDGARRLYADRDRILAEAAALDRELHALLGEAVPTIGRQIGAAAAVAQKPILGEGGKPLHLGEPPPPPRPLKGRARRGR